ncbi:2,3-bisphosphoglycerate-independent phosphoglycerate mutase [Taibaiella lutea]|uniref:2,3-bisphosphoglycerate-independent phosphoglycerate mutase n=1 Tax=Taibaiella lutea TaxID=2608001 RepID=A0A5M6CRQ2_9BACT|nr:2,3-bisphosphoglycerate-independent phosphoglycerate mutase [Taibaiella lutea]KAA5536632.1 2,3-bisphosphoglycerate-independent phosphoglycerate mutase [Taibaiella lutea]
MKQKRAILIIMDGWGHGKVRKADAIANADTPFVSGLYEKYPNSELITCGEAVGLPEGQMGNSEVGHLNIGAGRIVYQELERINVAIRNNSLKSNKTLTDTFDYCKANNKVLHFIGLVSDGGVHSHINHIKALCDYAKEAGIQKYAVHAFTDGRDTDPKSGLNFIKDLDSHLQNTNGVLASVTGRYYAMDRDKRWERVKLAYDAMVHGTGVATSNMINAIAQSYEADITDEFIKPIIKTDANGHPVATIQDGDAVICFNFRTDRCREITAVLTQKAFPEQGMQPLQLHYVTMTEYDHTFKNVNVIFFNDNLNNTIGEVISKNHLKQIRIAETEKYPHVTFFFSGGREEPFEGETRIMRASPKDVPTYDLKPEMSANEITEAILPEIEHQTADFICLNFANTDMVGHTGVWEAAVKAAETVDHCVSRIVPLALEKGYGIFLTADHGNSDYIVNEDGTPNTAHTLNLVPLFFISNDYKGKLDSGKLGDLAPTMLKYMGIDIPKEMTGNILIHD